MILIGLIDQGDNEEILQEAIRRTSGQADKLVIVSNKFVGLNNIEVLAPDQVDGPYSTLLKYSLKNKYDFVYTMSSSSFLDNGCVNNNINFLKNWNKLYGIEHFSACAAYSDTYLRLSNGKQIRQYLESVSYHRILKNEFILDNLLIDLKKFGALNIGLSQIKSNIELIFMIAQKSLILHNPLPTHSLKYRGPNDNRDIKVKYASVYLPR